VAVEGARRPGLREQITLDLYIVRNIAKLAAIATSSLIPQRTWSPCIDELGSWVFEEMDYLHASGECRSLRLGSPATIPAIAVCRPSTARPTSRRVLTMNGT